MQEMPAHVRLLRRGRMSLPLLRRTDIMKIEIQFARYEIFYIVCFILGVLVGAIFL